MTFRELYAIGSGNTILYGHVVGILKNNPSFVYAAGDFASAIETLVTAISLIKQSKIASDDRCKILISSLQDTLHGIEEKSYGSRFVNYSTHCAFICRNIC